MDEVGTYFEEEES